jgi:2-polyprenyl-3-methyl-5-hydroxy-6-metoxy-1,4-benzoquinol methylase
MPEDIRTCMVCGSERSAPFDQRSYRGHRLTYRICQHCGLVFQSPRMTEAESTAFYAEQYRLLQEGSRDPTARNRKAQTGRAASLLRFAQAEIPSVKRHLDIGCSLGVLLQHFQGVFHNQAVGVEPGEAHRTYAREQGLTVYTTLNELEEAGEERFDLVSMAHVLEHLMDPIAYLKHLRESLLAGDGKLILEVPNLYAHDSFEVAHLYAFSAHTLHEVLRLSGFEMLKFEKHGRPNSALFPLFLTTLCTPARQPDSNPVLPERFVSIKRHIGMLRRRILARLFAGRAWLGGG